MACSPQLAQQRVVASCYLAGILGPVLAFLLAATGGHFVIPAYTHRAEVKVALADDPLVLVLVLVPSGSEGCQVSDSSVDLVVDMGRPCLDLPFLATCLLLTS